MAQLIIYFAQCAWAPSSEHYCAFVCTVIYVHHYQKDYLPQLWQPRKWGSYNLNLSKTSHKNEKVAT